MLPLFSKVTSLRVVSLKIQETGSYNSIFMRPYVTDLDHRVMNAVSDRINEAIHQAENITPMTFKGMGNAIVRPSSVATSEIFIPNGWNNPRLRFILEVECEHSSGGRSRYYYTGYTSSLGVDQSGAIDPNMEFVVNSVVRTRLTNMYTPGGQVLSENMVASKHVLCDPGWSGATSPQQTYMMRPEDIINYKGVSHVLSNLGGHTIDARNMVQSNAATSSTNNGLAHNYAASILNSHVKAFTAAGHNATESEILGEARLLVPEAMENPLLNALAQIRGSGVLTNIFSYRELCTLDSNTDPNTVFFPLESSDIAKIHRAGQTRTWDGQDMLTVAANTLSQAVPAIMSGLMIRAIAFTSTNATLVNNFHTTVHDSRDYNSLNTPARVQAFIARLENEILYDMCFGGDIQYYVDVTADTTGDIRIRIGLDGKPPEDFAYPLFSSATGLPILTTQFDIAHKTADDFSCLMDHVQQMAGDIPTTMIDTSYV